MAIKLYVTFALMLSMGYRALSADGSIRGRVTSNEGEPLIGASVFLQGTVRGTTTNAHGEFRITFVSSGTYTLVFSMVGYQRETRSNIVVGDGIDVSLDVQLTQTPIPTEQVVITANKREQSLQDVPVSVAVMDAAELELRNSQTIEEAIRYVPGVNITGRQVNIRGSSGYAIAVGSRVMMMVDGIPFITGDTGELIFESVPVGQIDRIEVVKGASSALYGTSALGGVVNVITKQIPETPETYLRTYGGLYDDPSFESWKWTDKRLYFTGVSVSHAFRAGDLGMVLALSRQTDDGYRRNDNRKRYNVYVKTREEFGSDNSLTMNFGLLSEEGGKFNYWQNLDSATYPFRLQRDDQIESSRHYLSGAYNDVFAENFLFTAKGLWNHNKFVSTTFHDSGQGRWRDIRGSTADGFRVDATGVWLASDVHTVTFGVNGQLDIVSSNLFDNRRAYGAALFAQDEMKLTDDFAVTLGGRFDLQTLYLLNSGPQINPKLGLTYRLAEGTALRASIGSGFRIPSVAEAWAALDLGVGFFIPSPGLKPEKSLSYEVGVSQQLWDFGSVDVAAFGTNYENLIEPRPFTKRDTINFVDTLFVQWQNITKARVLGVETSIKLGFFDGALLYNLGYTYVYPKDLTLSDILPYRPRHVLYTNILGRIGM
ncbi:MAG: TonB-dependent receptor, partial [Ignavibacteriae bacterium]|nr:TonB-dependent receptor [Ignavibacteriota bacterium]